jgi:hypothetical protein
MHGYIDSAFIHRIYLFLTNTSEANDYFSLNIQYFQNVVTVSSALLILIPTFLEKAFHGNIKGKNVASFSIIFFGIAIATSIFSQMGMTIISAGLLVNSASRISLGTLITNNLEIAMAISFFLGILLLTIFVVMNFWEKKQIVNPDSEKHDQH